MILVWKPEGKRSLGDLSVGGWIISGLISRKCDVVMWTVLGWTRTGTSGGHVLVC